jgi:hypothetical protein
MAGFFIAEMIHCLYAQRYLGYSQRCKQMKVLLVKDDDYAEMMAALQRAYHDAQTQCWLAEAFRRFNGVHWHAYSHWRLQRRKYSRLLRAALQA